jgi:mRNA-degrading endonuclease RelE of RelBE toxin-antitoxin system
MSSSFRIQYAIEAVHDIRRLRVFDQRAITQEIERHLSIKPLATSRSRIKRMDQPFWSQFRLRVGHFRVYYDVDEPAGIVSVLRVLHKGAAKTPEEPR